MNNYLSLQLPTMIKIFAMTLTRNFTVLHQYFIRCIDIILSIPDIRLLDNRAAFYLIRIHVIFNSRKDHDLDIYLPTFKRNNYILLEISLIFGSKIIVLTYDTQREILLKSIM